MTPDAGPATPDPELTADELLRAVLDFAPVRVTALDREGCFILPEDPNPARTDNTQTPAQPRGISFFDLYAHQTEAHRHIRRALAGEEVSFIGEEDGVTYEIHLRPRRTKSGELAGAIMVANVVTEKLATERSLRVSEQRLRRIVDSSIIGILLWDRAGAITDANDAFLELVGHTREDLEAGRLDWIAMTPPEYTEIDRKAMEQVLATGVCTPFEKEYVRKDGQRVAVLIGAAAFAHGEEAGAAFVLDVSEKKRRERERDAAVTRLRTVVDNAPLVLWAVNSEGILTLSEGRGLQALGLKPGQVVGMSAFEFYADAPAVAAGIRRGLDGEEFTEIIEVGGTVFESRFSPLRAPDGRVNGVLGVAIDITEKRRAEREREELQARLLQVQKLESLGLLAGGIAHDFNNILTAILGAASTALLVLPEESPAREDVDQVVRAARKAAELTRQMLAYSGKGHFEIRPIDLSLHVHELATLLETTLPKKVQLRLELMPNLPAVEADVAQVQQIIMNLVINGAESIGDRSGTVLVTTGVQDLDDFLAKDLFASDDAQPGRYVYLEVHDTGSGMDDATKAKIFDPFFTTKFTGRGLGLAAVLGIVRAHAGAVKVYSSPGRGSTFKVFFPATDRVPATVARETASFRGEGLVLVIDDDASVRHVTRRMLEHMGFTVTEAENGRRGAELFAANQAEIVLVVLDMTMPEMNGEETFRELRRVREGVPVLLTSGYNEIEATRRFTAKGLAGFLQKPYTPTELITKLVLALGNKGKS